jgi:hypothetical protein
MEKILRIIGWSRTISDKDRCNGNLSFSGKDRFPLHLSLPEKDKFPLHLSLSKTSFQLMNGGPLIVYVKTCIIPEWTINYARNILNVDL